MNLSVQEQHVLGQILNSLLYGEPNKEGIINSVIEGPGGTIMTMSDGKPITLLNKAEHNSFQEKIRLCLALARGE